MRHDLRALAPALVLLVASGCYTGLASSLDDGSASGSHDDGAGGDEGTGAGETTGSDEEDESCAVALVAPSMRRLTVREYTATVRDLVGADPSIAADLPPDTFIDGFDNHAVALGVSTVHADRFMSAAATLAADVMSDAERRALVVGCELDGPDRDACLAAFVEGFGRRAYRRPLTVEESDELLALAEVANGDADPYAAASVAMQAILQSPHFLYRVEIGAPDPETPDVRRLTGYELATRLSYLLWGSTPSDDLLDSAAAGALDDADGIEAAARAMLDDPRAREGFGAFTTQWVRLPLLDYVQRDSATYPLWSDALRLAMAEETRRVLDDFVWDENAALLDVLVATHTRIDAALAELYALPAPAADWDRVALGDGTHRGGLLTQASLLTLAASSETTAPILRGKLVRDVFLCAPIDLPPSGVPEIPEPEPGESVRDRLERHRSDPACSGCHAFLDPIGFGLEQYDLVGSYRDADADGNPLGGAGEVADLEPSAFTGPFELGARLREAPQVSACAMTQLFRFVHGRTETDDDVCALERLREHFEDADGNLPETIIALVRSEEFRTMGDIE